MKEKRLFSQREVEVPCTVEIAETSDALFAHVVLEGVDVGPGDIVQVHGAPTRFVSGEHLVCTRQATVVRAGWLKRFLARLGGPVWLLIHD
jgi:hypothetical protein